MRSRVNIARAELGYWVGNPYWNRGFCTEAVIALIRHWFADLGLNRICSLHRASNQASGRVSVKNGLRHEGPLRQHVEWLGVFEDMETYGVLRSDLPPALSWARPALVCLGNMDGMNTYDPQNTCIHRLFEGRASPSGE